MWLSVMQAVHKRDPAEIGVRINEKERPWKETGSYEQYSWCIGLSDAFFLAGFH